MRFTKEFKLECIKKYQKGEYIADPGGCSHKTFRSTVCEWARIFKELGEAGLEHKKPKRSWKDKMDMIQRVLGGESVRSVALSNGIQGNLLSKWCKIYRERGVDGLKSSVPGRKPKTMEKPKERGGSRAKEELERENELLRAENEYLKKLDALVRGRKGRQPRRK